MAWAKITSKFYLTTLHKLGYVMNSIHITQQVHMQTCLNISFQQHYFSLGVGSSNVQAHWWQLLLANKANSLI